MLVTSSSFFSHDIFKSPLSQGYENQGLFGKELKREKKWLPVPTMFLKAVVLKIIEIWHCKVTDELGLLYLLLS